MTHWLFRVVSLVLLLASSVVLAGCLAVQAEAPLTGGMLADDSGLSVAPARASPEGVTRPLESDAGETAEGFRPLPSPSAEPASVPTNASAAVTAAPDGSAVAGSLARELEGRISEYFGQPVALAVETDYRERRHQVSGEIVSPSGRRYQIELRRRAHYAAPLADELVDGSKWVAGRLVRLFYYNPLAPTEEVEAASVPALYGELWPFTHLLVYECARGAWSDLLLVRARPSSAEDDAAESERVLERLLFDCEGGAQVFKGQASMSVGEFR
jgi:hypothetical protein